MRIQLRRSIHLSLLAVSFSFLSCTQKLEFSGGGSTIAESVQSSMTDLVFLAEDGQTEIPATCSNNGGSEMVCTLNTNLIIQHPISASFQLSGVSKGMSISQTSNESGLSIDNGCEQVSTSTKSCVIKLAYTPSHTGVFVLNFLLRELGKTDRSLAFLRGRKALKLNSAEAGTKLKVVGIINNVLSTTPPASLPAPIPPTEAGTPILNTEFLIKDYSLSPDGKFTVVGTKEVSGFDTVFAQIGSSQGYTPAAAVEIFNDGTSIERVMVKRSSDGHSVVLVRSTAGLSLIFLDSNLTRIGSPASFDQSDSFFDMDVSDTRVALIQRDSASRAPYYFYDLQGNVLAAGTFGDPCNDGNTWGVHVALKKSDGSGVFTCQGHSWNPIYFRRFDPAGNFFDDTPAMVEASNGKGSWYDSHEVAMDSEGRFAILWSQYGSPSNFLASVYGADGSLVKDVTIAPINQNAYLFDITRFRNLRIAANGNFIFLFSLNPNHSLTPYTHFARYTPDGNLLALGAYSGTRMDTLEIDSMGNSYVISDDSTSVILNAVNLTANEPFISMSTDGGSFDFGTLLVNATSDKTITLTNVGTAAATALQVTLPAQFSFKGGTYPGQGGTCTQSLAIGQTCNLAVRFTAIPATAPIANNYSAATNSNLSLYHRLASGITRAQVVTLSGRTSYFRPCAGVVTPAPVSITSCIDLQAIPANSELNYRLANDIDCSGIAFVPIVNFKGVFQGNKKVISNLSINNSIGSGTGLFGTADGAAFCDVGFIHTSIVGNTASVGALLGNGTKVSVERSFSTGSVKNNYQAGAPGWTWSTTGGLVGHVSGNPALLADNFSHSTVIGSTDYTGGLVGAIDPSDAYLTRSFATGDVSLQFGTRGAGLTTYTWSPITDSFSTGNAPYGLCINGFSTLTNSFFTGGIPAETCGTYQSLGSTYFQGAVFAAAKQPFQTWDFSSVWQEANADFPSLKGFNYPSNWK